MYGTRKKMLIVRWLARLLSGVMFLFWGAFFLEHLWEWFVKPLPETPPLKVWVSQFGHLALLFSYLLAMRWDCFGGVLIICSTMFFFVWIGMSITWSSAVYVGMSLLPGVLLLVAASYARRTAIG